eukprot:1856082-Rhodomonas_salina.1
MGSDSNRFLASYCPCPDLGTGRCNVLALTCSRFCVQINPFDGTLYGWAKAGRSEPRSIFGATLVIRQRESRSERGDAKCAVCWRGKSPV